MAEGSRTLKLSILADVDNLKKGLTDAGTDTETFGGKLSGFGKAAGAAFAVAGAAALAYAGALLVDGVKAAVEDEAAQVKLATAIQNVTTATDATIASVESYITQTALAVGVSDDELRPSFARLVKSTGDVEAAMKLQGVALDASVGSGKSLETTSNLIAKAFDGNTAALAKLDIGLTAAEVKTMSFDEAIAAVTATYEGSANAAADTFAGKIDRLKIAFSWAWTRVGMSCCTRTSKVRTRSRISACAKRFTKPLMLKPSNARSCVAFHGLLAWCWHPSSTVRLKP